jgi:hypothetical protein
MPCTITNLTAVNAVPMAIGNAAQAAPVVLYDATALPDGQPALFPLNGQSDPTQPGYPAIDVTIAIPPGTVSTDTKVQLVGTCAQGAFGGMAVIPQGATELTMQVGATPAICTFGRFFLCSPITWTLQNQGPIHSGDPREFLTQVLPLELYFGPQAGVSTGMALETVRLDVARDLAQPFFSTPTTGSETLAACAMAAFQAPPGYPPYGQWGHYGGYWKFDLTDWLFAQSGLNPSPLPADCMDSAGMCCLLLQLQPDPSIAQVWAGQISPAGYLQPTLLRGTASLTPAGFKFNYHYVSVVLGSDGSTTVCDATIDPHLGDEAPQTYLDDTFDLKDYPYAPQPGPPSEWGVPPTPLNQRSVKCPMYVDGQPFPPGSAPAARPAAFEAARRAFAQRVGLPPAGDAAVNVSADRLDPATACPALAALGPVHAQLTRGAMARRYRVFGRG